MQVGALEGDGYCAQARLKGLETALAATQRDAAVNGARASEAAAALEAERRQSATLKAEAGSAQERLAALKKRSEAERAQGEAARQELQERLWDAEEEVALLKVLLDMLMAPTQCALQVPVGTYSLPIFQRTLQMRGTKQVRKLAAERQHWQKLHTAGSVPPSQLAHAGAMALAALPVSTSSRFLGDHSLEASSRRRATQEDDDDSVGSVTGSDPHHLLCSSCNAGDANCGWICAMTCGCKVWRSAVSLFTLALCSLQRVVSG